MQQCCVYWIPFPVSGPNKQLQQLWRAAWELFFLLPLSLYHLQPKLQSRDPLSPLFCECLSLRLYNSWRQDGLQLGALSAWFLTEGLMRSWWITNGRHQHSTATACVKPPSPQSFSVSSGTSEFFSPSSRQTTLPVSGSSVSCPGEF